MKKGDTIQGRTLYKGGHYLRKYGISMISKNIHCLISICRKQNLTYWRPMNALTLKKCWLPTEQMRFVLAGKIPSRNIGNSKDFWVKQRKNTISNWLVHLPTTLASKKPSIITIWVALTLVKVHNNKLFTQNCKIKALERILG